MNNAVHANHRTLNRGTTVVRRQRVTSHGENRGDQNHVELRLETNGPAWYAMLEVNNLFVRNGNGLALHSEGCRRLSRLLAFYAKVMDEQAVAQ